MGKYTRADHEFSVKFRNSERWKWVANQSVKGVSSSKATATHRHYVCEFSTTRC